MAENEAQGSYKGYSYKKSVYLTHGRLLVFVMINSNHFTELRYLLWFLN